MKKQNLNNKLIFNKTNVTELTKSKMLSLNGGSISEDRPTNTFTVTITRF